jgi:hypothetical protein
VLSRRRSLLNQCFGLMAPLDLFIGEHKHGPRRAGEFQTVLLDGISPRIRSNYFVEVFPVPSQTSDILAGRRSCLLSQFEIHLMV